MDSISSLGILIGVIGRLWPVWLALAVILGLGYTFRRRLGLFGHLFGSGVGLAGLIIVLFWVCVALFADIIAPFDAIEQFYRLKRALPGTIEPQSGIPFYFGADNLGRDLFSRVVQGSRFVLLIAPAATFIAFLVGVTLGLPAGYMGGRVDAILTFLANLVLAFPVILLFYLLVTPGIRETAIPTVMAAVFFIFPIIFLCVLFFTRYPVFSVVCVLICV